MEKIYYVWNKNNKTHPTAIMTSIQSRDEDEIVLLKIPYLDPAFAESAIVKTNLRFWRTVSHLRWFVLRMRNNYVVSPHPQLGFSNPLYLHIENVRYYQDQGYFGERRLQKRTYQVDHRNHDALDASRQNLRIVTPAENAHNKVKKAVRPNMKPYTSKYKGVSVETRKLKSGKISTRYKVDFKAGSLRKRPSFKTEKAAARAYRDLCMKYIPEFSQPTPVSDSDSEEEEEEEEEAEEEAEGGGAAPTPIPVSE